ncbi:MAG TPA: hypothetical protein P5119_05795 [Candidatus Aminicenantes bacterium]|nr:hypothetical protein [Candidatus Aminicenantes bacterium]HRY64836.1 hypothetical protein [Candidatus Aminicenantes bacterium]HRZ71749.1 hypothetical protein [Candidatus Aminicenantes bacterium]
MSQDEKVRDDGPAPGGTEDKGQPRELTRRTFLYLAGIAGVSPVLDGLDPDQVARPQTLRPKAAARVQPAALNLHIPVLRPDDLLALDFECVNLTVKPGAPPRLVRRNASAPAYIIVHFPPQHIAEQAFFETTPEFNADPKEPTTAETPAPPPVQARISGPSRLAFVVPEAVESIPLTLESLLAWENFEPSLVPVALAPKIPVRAQAKPGASPAAGRRPAAAASASGLVTGVRTYVPPIVLPGGRQDRNVYQARMSKLPAQVSAALLKIIEPAAHQTALELPYRLFLSPHALNVWAHAVQPVTRGGRTELWHTRLAAAGPDGTIADTATPLMAVRAVWSPDCKADAPAPGPGHSNAPFRMSLDRQDRHEIVHLTSNFSLKLGTKAWEPKPVEVERLMLTSLGGWLDSSGAWLPTPLSVEEWRHRATLGRDHYVKVVYKGFLMPFGHAASLIKVTERKFRKGADGRQIAYLFQRMYIVVRDPEKTFPAPFQPADGREIPFRAVRITSLMTPPLEDPAASEILPGALQSAFWPRVQNRDFLFHCQAADWAGERVEFAMPMAFVDAIYAFDPNKMQSVAPVYSQKSELERRRPALNGQTVAFAAAAKKGDTDLEVESISFAVRTPAGRLSPAEWRDRDQPLFFPVMEEAAVSIPALKAMVGLGGTAISYPRAYLESGLGGGNKGEVFAAIAAAPVLDFGGQGDKAGGVASPSFPIVGLSRALGPVGGLLPEGAGDPLAAAESALADAVGGRFDPAKFFNDQAKLLGGILLKDIIRAVADFMSGGDAALTIKNEVQQDAAGLPSAVRTYMTWKPDLQDFTIFVAGRDGNKASLTLDVKNIVYLDGREPDYELKGELKDFTLDLINPIISLIRVEFDRFVFTARKGQKTDFDPKIAKIEFAGPLDFVKELLDTIKLPGSGDGGGLGGPIIDIGTSGATLGYTFNIPTLAFGVFSLQNMKFTAAVTLPFTGDPLTFRFAFNERSNPFLLTVSLFGGGGFFAIELQPQGIKLIEGSLEFGGSFAMNIGVASGGVTLMAGIYFRYEDDNVTISGYVRCVGCLDVLGIISISAEFYLALTYEQATNRVWGQASLTVKVKVLFFSAKVTLKVERSFGHSPAPLFADIMDESHWLDYCEAFA